MERDRLDRSSLFKTIVNKIGMLLLLLEIEIEVQRRVGKSGGV